METMRVSTVAPGHGSTVGHEQTLGLGGRYFGDRQECSHKNTILSFICTWRAIPALGGAYSCLVVLRGPPGPRELNPQSPVCKPAHLQTPPPLPSPCSCPCPNPLRHFPQFLLRMELEGVLSEGSRKKREHTQGELTVAYRILDEDMYCRRGGLPRSPLTPASREGEEQRRKEIGEEEENGK